MVLSTHSGRLVLWSKDLLSQDGWVQRLRISFQDLETKREAKKAADILGGTAQVSVLG